MQYTLPHEPALRGWLAKRGSYTIIPKTRDNLMGLEFYFSANNLFNQDRHTVAGLVFEGVFKPRARPVP